MIKLTNDLSSYQNVEGFDQSMIEPGGYYYVVAVLFREHPDFNGSNIGIAISENSNNSWQLNSLKLIDYRLLFVVKASDVESEFVTLNIKLTDNDGNELGELNEFTYTEIVKLSHN